MVPPIQGRDHHDAHLRTERHHAGDTGEQRAQDVFHRLLAAGHDLGAGDALGHGAEGRRQYRRAARACRASIEDPVERRKRSVQRGRGALEVLDDLKIGLLAGNLDTSTVNRLRDAAANLKSSSGDPGLDAVLSEIELRVEVELAKAGRF